MTASADVGAVRLRYSDLGDGRPLLCLHGGMGIDRRSLEVPGILNLSARGIRLIIPDQRGHGKSSISTDAEYTHETWATDAHELARHLGISRFALLGHSYGGFLALEYARRWPETLACLVLVATSAGPVRAQRRAFSSDSAFREYFRGVWPTFFTRADKHWALFDAITFTAGAYNAAFTRELPAYDLRDAASRLDVPMLLMVGSDDWYLPHMEWLAAHTKHSTLCVLERVGHFPFVEAPDQFVTTVASFLNHTLPTAGAGPAPGSATA